jgi:hypothetical protein
MSLLKRKALHAAILAGLCATSLTGGSVSVRNAGDAFTPKYMSYPGSYWNPVPKSKRRSAKGVKQKHKKQKGVNPGKKKHRVKKKGKR